jgi:hypothetical protein
MRAQADVKLIAALIGFMQNHRRRRKHADNQNAQNDVIGKVHGVVPAMLKVACTRAINVTEQRDRTRFPPPWSLFPLIRRTGDPPPWTVEEIAARSGRGQASSRSALHQGSRGSN